MLTRIVRFALVGVFACAIAGYGTAYAQPDDDDDTEGVEDEGMGEDEGMEEGEGDGDAEAEPEGEGEAEAEVGGDEGDDEAAGGYPIEIIDRPLVLPKGAFEARAMIAADKSFDGVMLTVGAGYGVMPKLEAGLAYGLMLKEFEAKGALLLYAAYEIMAQEKLDVDARVQFGYDLLGEAMAPLTIGADVRYKVTPKIAVYAMPGVVVWLEELLPDVKPMYLDVPIGVGFQAAENIHARLETNLAQVEIADWETGFIGADFMPVKLMGWYSLSNLIDVGAGVGMDLKADEIGDSVMIYAGASYRGGL